MDGVWMVEGSNPIHHHLPTQTIYAPFTAVSGQVRFLCPVIVFECQPGQHCKPGRRCVNFHNRYERLNRRLSRV